MAVDVEAQRSAYAADAHGVDLIQTHPDAIRPTGTHERNNRTVHIYLDGVETISRDAKDVGVAAVIVADLDIVPIVVGAPDPFRIHLNDHILQVEIQHTLDSNAGSGVIADDQPSLVVLYPALRVLESLPTARQVGEVIGEDYVGRFSPRFFLNLLGFGLLLRLRLVLRL